MSGENWKVVLQTPQKPSIIYNETLHQLRAISQPDTSIIPRNYTSPSYFQILSEILRKYPSALPLSVNDFLMNGYFDTYFPKRKKIGSGGCGSVYRVEHSLAGINLAVYACKVIPVGEFTWLQKVINEVKLLEKLNKTPHPLILAYKHCWIEEWQPASFGPKIPCLFILMEYSELGSVEDLLSTKRHGIYKEIPIAEAWQIFISIILAVRHIHSLGILHRDLKLSNILMMKDHQHVRFVLSDFGTSIDQSDTDISILRKRTGATGTVETMAPELLVQDENENYLYHHTIASDIWSIGVMLFSLFFAVNPFSMEDGEQKLRKFKTIDQLIDQMNLQEKEKQIPDLALKFIKRTLVLDPLDRMPIEQMIGQPFIMELIKHMNLNELVRADGPNVFVVSPSMEDLASSIPLPLTMDKYISSDSSESCNNNNDNNNNETIFKSKIDNIQKKPSTSNNSTQNNLTYLINEKEKALRIILFLALLSVPYHSNILKYIHISLSIAIIVSSTKTPSFALFGPILSLSAMTFHFSDVPIFLILMMFYISFLLIYH